MKTATNKSNIGNNRSEKNTNATFQFELSKRIRIQEDFKLTPGGHHRREIVKLQTIIHTALLV